MSDKVAQKLTDAGLVTPIFDVAAIEQDVRGRIELDASLDSLIGSGDAPHPAKFDPANPA